MLRGDEEFDPALEDLSGFEARDVAEPVVSYNAGLPPEYFDIVFIDECHRSIYTLWRQVLEYFDAYLIGLTATPAKHTFGFFNQNLVMEYTREQAVADRRIPLPPPMEQDRILLAVESGLSSVDALRVTLSKNSRQVSRLRQSILTWAFEGKLVDQDPNDEPASVLLARIRAQRAAKAEEAKPTRVARKGS